MFRVVWDHKDPYQAVYHVCSHFRPISVCLCKKSIFTLKRGYFRLFFTKLPILAEYASAIEYSMGPEKIFSDQDCAYLQILVYGIFISFLVIELQKTWPLPPPFGRAAASCLIHILLRLPVHFCWMVGRLHEFALGPAKSDSGTSHIGNYMH